MIMAPTFSKTLTPTGIGSALPWPITWLGFLPPFLDGANQVCFRALDSNNRVWTFTCSVRRQGPYPKPVIVGSSWLPFVREKGLGVGDMVTFSYDPDQPIKFGIRVRRHKCIRLMGHDIVGYVDEERVRTHKCIRLMGHDIVVGYADEE